jgi:hypothetical protein
MRSRWVVALLAYVLADPIVSCPIEGRWWEAEALRKALGVAESATQSFRHSHGPDAAAPEYAYATTLIRSGTERVVRRSAVVLRLGAVLTFEMANGPADRPLVKVRNCGAALAQGPIESLDLAGARVADHVVLFHADTRSATSAVSFDVAGPARLKFLIVGLNVGTWEIWHNGFLVDPGGAVERDSGVLRFNGAPGGYFLRRIG